MEKCTRREFLRHAAVATGALAMSSPLLQSRAASVSYQGSDIVPLGKTGIKVSRLAQGTGFNGSARSSEHTRMGKEKLEALLHHSLDHGIRFLDMADLYGSHPFVKDVVKGLNRDRYVLLSKIWVRKESWCTPSGGAVEEIDRFRKELGVEMIDVCLLHCMTDKKWPDTYERVRDDLSGLKQKGVVRAVGVSCHDFGALEVAASHPWVDVIFARINHKGGSAYSMDGPVEDVSAVLKQARRDGKAIVGMKIFGAGKLRRPDEKDASLNYVFKNGLVDAITVGMLKTEEVDDTLARMAKVGKA